MVTMTEGQRIGSVYVHVPFCRARCTYCDFAIQVGSRDDPRFSDLVVAELELRGYGAQNPETVFFGGGTPSLLDPLQVERILARVGVMERAEVSLEANPEDVDEARCALWVNAGVTRLSLGVQSFDEAILSYFGRHHSRVDALHAIATARASGFESVSIDVIYGAPGESEYSWRETIGKAIDAGVDHVSAYGLTVERATVLGARRTVVDDEVLARHYLIASELLEGAGFENYEISNWARPGHECRHNINYWRRGDYLGVGPSAHSKIDRMRSWNVSSWPRYQMRVEAGLIPQEGCEPETPESVDLEQLYLGLRTREGVPSRGEIPSWAKGLIVASENRWMLTREGRLQADAVVTRLA